MPICDTQIKSVNCVQLSGVWLLIQTLLLKLMIFTYRAISFGKIDKLSQLFPQARV